MESGCRNRLRGCLIRVGELMFLLLPQSSRFSLGTLLMCSASMISYPNYKFIFPIKALGMFAKRHGNLDLFED